MVKNMKPIARPQRVSLELSSLFPPLGQNHISKATFGVTPSEYKKLKGLKRENLRDHMDDFELIFNMLSERATTELHRTEDSTGL